MKHAGYLQRIADLATVNNGISAFSNKFECSQTRTQMIKNIHGFWTVMWTPNTSLCDTMNHNVTVLLMVVKTKVFKGDDNSYRICCFWNKNTNRMKPAVNNNDISVVSGPLFGSVYLLIWNDSSGQILNSSNFFCIFCVPQHLSVCYLSVMYIRYRHVWKILQCMVWSLAWCVELVCTLCPYVCNVCMSVWWEGSMFPGEWRWITQ